MAQLQTINQQHLASARACLLGARDRLATFRRLGSLNSNDRDLHANAVQDFYYALDLVWLPRLEFASTDVRGTVRNIDKIKSGIKAHWGGAPAASVALAIIDGISALAASDTDTLRVSNILQMLDVTELSDDIVAALAILVQSEFAILRSGGEFLDQNGERYKLSPKNFQRVLTLDTLIHPITQIELEEASDQVVPIFELATELFESSKR